MATGDLKVRVDKINTLGGHAKDLATHVTDLPGHYSNVTAAPEFGAGVSTIFQDAVTMRDAYLNQLEKFVHAGSNLTDLADQLNLLNTGAGKIVTEYNAGILTEANAADQFRQAVGGSGNSTGA
jgi:hypothetical protein